MPIPVALLWILKGILLSAAARHIHEVASKLPLWKRLAAETVVDVALIMGVLWVFPGTFTILTMILGGVAYSLECRLKLIPRLVEWLGSCADSRVIEDMERELNEDPPKD